MIHDLKTWPECYEAIVDGRKRFEVRRTNDRVFQVGDVLRLREWDPRTAYRSGPSSAYSGRFSEWRVTYVAAGAFGIPEGLAVLGIEPITAPPGAVGTAQ